MFHKIKPKLKIQLSLYLIFCLSQIVAAQQKDITISGYIKDANTGEELIAATVYIPEIKSGTISNTYGFYSISLKKGQYHISVSYMGYKSQEIDLNLQESQTKTIQMVPDDNLIKEIDVFADRKDKNIASNEMSINKLQMKTIMKIPALMGEVDVLRSIHASQSSGGGGRRFNACSKHSNACS